MASEPERRDLKFSSLDDAVADAQQLAAGNVRTVGNHSFGQILEHLARTHDMATGKAAGPKMPWYMRMMMPFLRNSILNGPVKPGFKLPSKAESYFWPNQEFDVHEALAHLKESVENYNTNGPLAIHPVFGKATREQIDRLNINHCAMHLSFAHPA